MRSSKSKFLIIGTVALGLITAGLVYMYLTQAQTAAVDQVMTNVVTATRKIPQGTKISPEMVKTVQMPVKYAHPSAITDTKAAIGNFATVDLFQDDTILTTHIASEKTANELPYKIPEGTRAITIAINQLSGVAGHIKPGHYVDVLMSYKDGEAIEDNKVVTLLQNILVLAVGPDLQKKEGIQESENITLAVTPSAAQLVMLSENIGRMKLVLRPSGEDNKPALPSVNLRNVRTQYP
jgi:pilus assembly protein CpaB